MKPEPDAVLTIDEMAEYLKIAKSTLYKLAQEGRIPAQKVGRHWRFRKAAIDRWLDATGQHEPEEAQAPKGGEGRDGRE